MTEAAIAEPTVEQSIETVLAPQVDLIYEDGIPMDSPAHRAQMEMLIDSTHEHWRGRTDYYTGGNMFLYFSVEQARNRDYRGPDFFAVLGVDGTRSRKAWVVWEEGGRYPDIIIELLSESTRNEDLGAKKTLYERTFRTTEYFCYDLDRSELRGWRLQYGNYRPLEPDHAGRLSSQVMELRLGEWQGTFHREHRTWLRFFSADGVLVPLAEEAERRRADAERERADAERERADAERERADAERERAHAERRRAEAAEAELASMRERLRGLKAE
ncbi:MAG: Uma2 family endonuclease [Candidatus Schekmanbacteria bacterium]|nr:Uma2 family endonuclease [Candidatus Schekmanbacteria bacterium]